MKRINESEIAKRLDYLSTILICVNTVIVTYDVCTLLKIITGN